MQNEWRSLPRAIGVSLRFDYWRQIRHRMSDRKTAHKSHTTNVFTVLRVLCVHNAISNLLITQATESFNSVPGHHLHSDLVSIGDNQFTIAAAVLAAWALAIRSATILEVCSIALRCDSGTNCA